MRNPKFPAVLIALLFCFSASVFTRWAPGHPQETAYSGTLSGHVKDMAAHPIEGARVRVHFHEDYEEAFSNAQGYYLVTDIPTCYCLKETCASRLGYKEEWVNLSISENTVYNFDLEAVPLTASGNTIPSMGGGVNFFLNAGADHAGRKYALLGSVSGTHPGIPLPGGTTLPLNWDLFTTYTFLYANTEPLTGFMDALDGNGQSTADLGLYFPLTPFIGTVIYFAYTLYDPFGFVSNVVEVEIVN